jgi:hypothetical protein
VATVGFDDLDEVVGEFRVAHTVLEIRSRLLLLGMKGMGPMGGCSRGGP